MKFYTNIAKRGNSILYRGVENGVRVQKKIRFKPTFYVKSKERTTTRNIEGDYISPIEFDSMSESIEFIDNYKQVDNFSVYGMENYRYAFLSEAFPNDIEFDQSKINTAAIDIEVKSDEGFPEPRLAVQPVTAICMVSSLDNVYHVWGCGEYDVDKTELEGVEIEYHQCYNENELLSEFLLHWVRNYPDILTGWNSRLFDLPYLVNRMSRVLEPEVVKKLSPWGNVRERSIRTMVREEQVFEIEGIEQLDYLDLYKKFTYTNQESYRLDHIAFVELGDRKLDYSEVGSLFELYKQDFQKFIDYNIKDTLIINRLEEKTGLITLALTLAYKGRVNYQESMGSVGIWDSILYHEMKQQRIFGPVKGSPAAKTHLQGGYVKEPVTGMHRWVVSFDLNSLYPHIMMQYNISPETICRETMPDVTVDGCLEKQDLDIPADRNVTARGNLFRTDTAGLIPQIVERYYDERSVTKKEMLGAMQKLERAKDPSEKRALETEVTRKDNIQMAIKILMNSLYGVMSNQYFRYFDPRMAESITLTGQLTIRWAEKNINNYLNKILGTDKDYVIAIDTDSVYINLSDLVDKVMPDEEDELKIVQFIDNACKQKFEPLLESCYEELKDYLQAYQQKMVMGREVIASKGIWTGKKRYMLNVWNSEGVQYEEPKLKMMGIEAVKSSTPQSCRQMIKDCINVILDTDEKSVQNFISEKKNEFMELPIEEVSFPRGVRDMKKYADPTTTYGKGTPIHVRGSLVYNKMLEEKSLTKKYEKIQSGDKIKFCYMKQPNPAKENIFAFLDRMPEELSLNSYVDYDKQWDKCFIEPMKSILDVIGWRHEKIATLEDLWS